MRKALSIISSIVIIFVMVIMILIAGIEHVGIKPYSYENGSAVYVKSVAESDISDKIKIGDKITYILNENNLIATSVVHHIDFDNKYFYVLPDDLYKGENNENMEEFVPVQFSDLRGRALFILPYMGYVAAWMSDKIGLYITLAIMLVCFVTLILTAFLPFKNKQK